MSAARLGRVPVTRRMLIRSGVGSRVTCSTGASAVTQTSLERTPLRRLTARASGSSEIRQKPPGITFQPSGVAAAKTRSVIGCGSSRPFWKTGIVESWTTSCPT